MDWNGLAISAMAKGYQALGDERYLSAGNRAMDFILEHMRDENGRLLRTHRAGRSRLLGQCSDYAATVAALLDLYQAGFHPRRLHQAGELAGQMIDLFYDGENGGFFAVGRDHETLIVRAKDTDDNALPSGNSMAVMDLLRLARFLDKPDDYARARKTLLLLAEPMSKAPQMYGHLLCALDFYLDAPQEIVLAGDPGDEAYRALRAEVFRRFLPNTILAGTNGRSIETIPLLEGKAGGGGKAMAYVCSHYACRKPTSDPAELAAMLGR